jgi:hypothetical protein
MVQVSSKLEVQIVQIILTIWHAPTNPAIRHIRFVVSCTGLFFFDLGVSCTGLFFIDLGVILIMAD